MHESAGAKIRTPLVRGTPHRPDQFEARRNLTKLKKSPEHYLRMEQQPTRATESLTRWGPRRTPRGPTEVATVGRRGGVTL